jgi:hypothetical protein
MREWETSLRLEVVKDCRCAMDDHKTSEDRYLALASQLGLAAFIT